MYNALDQMWNNTPFVLKKSPFVTSFCTFDELAEVAGDEAVPIFCSDAKTHRFMEFDSQKNHIASPYRVREFETQIVRLNVKEFVDCSRAWTKQKLFLKVCIVYCCLLDLIFMPGKILHGLRGLIL